MKDASDGKRHLAEFEPLERCWLRVTEAADLLGMSPRTLYRSCKRGQVPFTKVPGIGLRIDKRRLDELLESRSLGPGKIKKEGV